MALSQHQLEETRQFINEQALQLGFQQVTVGDVSTDGYFEKFQGWVESGFHGEMSFLERNHELRQSPEKLHLGTSRVLSLRYDYLPQNATFNLPLKDPQKANISRYALGRDYHKLMRKKLAKLSQSIQAYCADFAEVDYRVFVDSAPVLETSFAEKSGLGWKGKHSLVINKDAGSWFFLGEIFINLPLELDKPVEDLCGSCSACIKLCPTDAILDGKTVDARRCISYLTIENKGAIPVELRAKMGNRIYGCDDCQLACPWNRFSETSKDKDFLPKNGLDSAHLLELWQWQQSDFENRLQGSPIRRIGYQSWLRNLAVALGNSDYHPATIQALEDKQEIADEMVKEHIEWAIDRLKSRQNKTFKLAAKTQKLINCVEVMLPRDA